MNPIVDILISLNFEKVSGLRFGQLADIVHILPSELEYSLPLEEEGDQGNVLLISIIFVVDSRGEYG